MEKTWWKEAIGYQIYVRSFKDSNKDGVGDLRGIIDKIDYLKYLGINMLYLNPVNKSPNDDNGYDVSDFYDIMDEFGTLDTFKELLEKLHQNEIKLIMDLVINHSSDEHPLFIDAKSSKKSKYHDWYIFRDANDGNVPNNWPSFFGGSAWEYNDETSEYYLHIFSKKQPDFNFHNEDLRKEIIKIIKYWKDLGVDGFRFDAVNHIVKDENFDDAKVDENGNIDFLPKIQNLSMVHDYIKELRKAVFNPSDYSKYVLIGEAGGIDYKSAYKYTHKDKEELDMLFHFDFHSVGRGDKPHLRRDINLVSEIKVPLRGWVNREDIEGWHPLFYSNHDTTRTVSRLGDDSFDSAKLLAAIQLTQRGTPFIYYGDEIAMTNAWNYKVMDFRDVAVKNSYSFEKDKSDFNEELFLKALLYTNRDNSRTPMQWDENLNSSFSQNDPWIPLNTNHKERNVKAQIKDENSVLNFYKRLIALRKSDDTLVYGKTIEYLKDDPKIYAFERIKDNKYLVIANYSKESTSLKNFIAHYKKENEYGYKENNIDSLEVIIDSDNKTLEGTTFNFDLELSLKPWQVLILKARN